MMIDSGLSKKNLVRSKISGILLPLGIVLGILTILFSQVLQYRKQEIRMEELRAGDLRVGSVTYDKLAEDVFTTVQLEFENGTTSKAKIVNGMVENGGLGGQLQFETESGEIVTGQVMGTIPMVIEDGSITEEKIAKVLIERIEKLEEDSLEDEESLIDTGSEFEMEDGSIVMIKLADDAVTTLKLADGSVTTVKIQDATITSGKIQDANILTRHLASGSITEVKIANGAVTSTKLGDSSVTTSKIQDGTILNTDISSSAAIAYSKLNLTGSLLLADLGQNGCTDGQVMKWDNGGSTWVCATDTDTNTQLSEAQVEGYITNGAIDLFTGSTMNAVALATETWVSGLGYITDGNTGWDNTYGFITAASSETLTNKSGNISMWTNDSGFITASSSETLTNKTIDGDDNTVQDLSVSSLKSGVLDTDLSTVSASDDTVASAKAIRTALNSLYPVGSIYINAANSTNPATLLGFGTWVSFGEGQVMVGLDSGDTDFDTLGETGGEKTHTLTTAEMPSHNHSFLRSAGTGAVEPMKLLYTYATQYTGTYYTSDAGGDEAHNNLQPYITVYMWMRTE